MITQYIMHLNKYEKLYRRKTIGLYRTRYKVIQSIRNHHARFSFCFLNAYFFSRQINVIRYKGYNLP